MTDEISFDLSASPGHLLHRATQFAAERFAQATGGIEVTPRQFAVLSAVAENEGLTQTQLVKATGVDRSTLAELVARMAAKGLLIREKAAGDARANAIRFTDAGRELYQTAIAGAAAADEAIVDALAKNKRANFVSALMRIAAQLDKADEREAKEAAKAAEKASAAKAKKKKQKKKKKARAKK